MAPSARSGGTARATPTRLRPGVLMSTMTTTAASPQASSPPRYSVVDVPGRVTHIVARKPSAATAAPASTVRARSPSSATGPAARW